MESNHHQIDIVEILMLPSHDEVMLLGKVYRAALTYDTRIYINSTQLNKIINELIRLNPEVEIADFVQNQSTEDGIIRYIDCTKIAISSIATCVFDHFDQPKQIRA